MNISNRIIGKETMGKAMVDDIEIVDVFAEALDNVLKTPMGRPTSQILTDVKVIDNLYFNLFFKFRYKNLTNLHGKKLKLRVSVVNDLYGNEVLINKFSYDFELPQQINKSSKVDIVSYLSLEDNPQELNDIKVDSNIKFIFEIIDDENMILSEKEWKTYIRDYEDVHKQSMINNEVRYGEKFSYLTYRDEFGTINGYLNELLFENTVMTMGVQIYPDIQYYLKLKVNNEDIRTFDLFIDREKEVEGVKKTNGFLQNGFSYLLPTGLVEVRNELPLDIFKDKLYWSDFNMQKLDVSMELLDNNKKVITKSLMELLI